MTDDKIVRSFPDLCSSQPMGTKEMDLPYLVQDNIEDLIGTHSIFDFRNQEDEKMTTSLCPEEECDDISLKKDSMDYLLQTDSDHKILKPENYFAGFSPPTGSLGAAREASLIEQLSSCESGVTSRVQCSLNDAIGTMSKNRPEKRASSPALQEPCRKKQKKITNKSSHKRMLSRQGVKLRRWHQDDMEKALAACLGEGLPASVAAGIFNVPRRTLSDRLKRVRVTDSAPDAMSTTLSPSVDAELGKIKRQRTKRRRWQEDDMEKALAACREQGFTASEAACRFKVNRRTLSYRLHMKVKIDCVPGRSTALSAEQEVQLCQYIEYMRNQGFSPTVNQIMAFAWSIDRKTGNKIFGDRGPCYGWWLKFCMRNPEMSKVKKGPSLDHRCKLVAAIENIKNYFNLLHGVLAENNLSKRPQDIYYCDDCVIDFNKSSKQVTVPLRMRTSSSLQEASSEHVSVQCCVSATGLAMSPMIIFKSEFPRDNYLSEGPVGALYGKQANGVMESELFLYWFKQIFLINARPTESKPVLLLLDSRALHCSPELIDCARQNNVVLLASQSHAMHLSQPLDVVVYKSFNVALSPLVERGKSLQGHLWIAKWKHVPRIVKKAFENSMTKCNIMVGFRKCGIHPFNPNAIDKSQLYKNQLISSHDIDLSINLGDL